MEKRNFITSVRTASSPSFGDELIEKTAELFTGSKTKGKQSDFEKKASQEDEMSDRGF